MTLWSSAKSLSRRRMRLIQGANCLREFGPEYADVSHLPSCDLPQHRLPPSVGMDDLYGNAWGDSSDITGDIHLPQTTSWTTPKLPTHHEADLAAPSWSTGTGIGWNEPSEDAHGFNWSGNDPDLAWSADTNFQDIPIRSSNETEVAEVHAISEKDEEEQTELGSEAETAEPQEDNASITLGSQIGRAHV